MRFPRRSSARASASDSKIFHDLGSQSATCISLGLWLYRPPNESGGNYMSLARLAPLITIEGQVSRLFFPHAIFWLPTPIVLVGESTNGPDQPL
jgi:hypothetical protein